MICPFAVWRGPIANMKQGGMAHPVRGLVLHVEEGTETGTDGWFHNPAAQASAHFGVARDGTLHQWVDTDDRAWAEAAGNAYWWSVETEGTHTEPLTESQVAALARLYGWLASLPDRIPTVLAESVDDRGFGWHGMGGAAWGGHIDCPGDLRRNQRADVLARIVRPAPTPDPPTFPVSEVTIDMSTLHSQFFAAPGLTAAGVGWFPDPLPIPFDKVSGSPIIQSANPKREAPYAAASVELSDSGGQTVVTYHKLSDGIAPGFTIRWFD